MKRDETLSLTGLEAAPAQTLGSVRLVPLLRQDAPGDLRIRAFDLADDGPTPVALAGRRVYTSYIPQGLVVSYTSDGAEAAFATSLGDDRPRGQRGRILHRMVKGEGREGKTERFRMLPLHLAMEGFLTLHFGGPEIAWGEYSRQALRRGLSPRRETSVRGTWLPGLEEALRVFEICPSQVGLLVFVADALASVFVVTHPDDYRRLHRSVVEDFFGQLLYEYAVLYPDVARVETVIDPARVVDLATLRAEVARARREWEGYTRRLTQGLFGRPVRVETVRTAGPFRLERFVPDFDPNAECHIGERIVRDDGGVEYMKTFRLSAAQVRRGFLLGQLASANWDLGQTAANLRCGRDELVRRLENAGFGYLLKPDVLAAAKAHAGKTR